MEKKNRKEKISGTSIQFLIWIIIWELFAVIAGSDLILPGPVRTVEALSGLITTGKFWLNVFWTLFRVVTGGLISFTAGSIAAVFAHRYRAVRSFLRLPVSFFKSIPVMAIIIYVILIIKADWVAVAVCFFMCFPIAYTNILSGLDSLDAELEELAKVYGMTERQKVSMIVRPALQPEIRAAANLISGMSWKVVVASEVLAIPGFSIGYQMLNSKYYLETPDLFAYIVVLIILSTALEKAVSYLVEKDIRLTGKRMRKEVEGSGKAVSPSDSVKVTLKGISKRYASEDGTEKVVLSNASMEFGQGVTALLGPSGKGKTTIMKLITGLMKEDSGSVSVQPEGQKADVLFQEDRLLPWLNVRDNMYLAFLNKMPSHESQESSAISTDPDKDVLDMAERLELGDSLDMMPAELSGGMAHRAALGRALLAGNPLLILDEPFRGLDGELKKRIIKRIEEPLRKSRSGEDRTVILITHDEDLAENIADRMIRI